MKLEKYLRRIKYKGNVKADKKTLTKLHQHHVLTIPFENLDIHLNKPIKLDLESIYEKVIVNKRGGFCYELNYLFHNFLNYIGFNSTIISSKIFDENEKLGPEFDHMSIVVTLENDWLVDVGYGDLFIEPIRIGDNRIKKDWFKFYQIKKLDKQNYLLSESKTGKVFKNRYVFGVKPRQIEDFDNQCAYKQYSEDSYFVKNKICTLPSKRGRTTLFNNKLIKRLDKQREEFQILTESQLNQILKETFDIEI